MIHPVCTLPCSRGSDCLFTLAVCIKSHACWHNWCFPGIASSQGDDIGYLNAGILKLGAFTALALGWFAPVLASYSTS